MLHFYGVVSNYNTIYVSSTDGEILFGQRAMLVLRPAT
jgi:hypothetical protein